MDRHQGHDSMLSRRSFVGGLALVGFSFTALGQLVGCAQGGSPAGSDGPGEKERLTVLFNDAPTSFDPVVGWDGWYTVCRGLTETLVQFDRNMDIRACLATSWSQDDEVTWRFTLREDVVFHSGAPMTPEAVKASLERTIAKSARAADKIRAESIEVDGGDIVITCTQPIATLPGEIAEPVFSIIDVAVADDTPEVSGTGPYKGMTMTAVENFIVTRHDSYWGGTPRVRELHNQTVTEPSARTMALQSGDTDVAWSIQASDLILLEQDQRFRVETCESVRMVFAFMNYRSSHLADKHVRQALSFATDRASICEKLLNGILLTNGSLFPSYLSYSLADSDQAQTYDPDKASGLLEEAGYRRSSDGRWEKDGEVLKLRIAYYQSRPELPVIAQALQDQYGKMGVAIDLELFENVADLFKTDGFDLMLYNTTTIGNGDPSYYLGLYYASDGSENANGYRNEQVDALVESMRRESDQQARFQMAEQAQRLILEDCPNLFFGSPIMNLACDARTRGFVLYPVEYYGVTHEVAYGI